jgi:NAD-dependent SIR2 family protein deacetylase
MAKSIVFLTGKSIASNVNECIHLYRRIVSFNKSADVAVITQSSEMHPEQAGCKLVIHLDSLGVNQTKALSVAKQADMFVVVGMAPNSNPSAVLLGATRPDCNIAIINKGSLDLPNEVRREHVLRMRDMSIGTGLLFLSMYRWMMDLIEE